MKRTEKFNFNSISKKQKVDENIDDVWGDDPEFDEVEKCITLATQQLCVQEQSQSSCVNNNLSLLSYNDFKLDPKVSSSTQAFAKPAVPFKNNQFQKPNNFLNTSNVSTISTVINKDISAQEYQQKLLQEIKKLESQNKKLTEKCETKDGENSILRSQLKQAQKTAESEKIQKLQQIDNNQHQWNEKYNMVVKEKDRVKCELDLKQIEVMNLKDKLKDLIISQNGILNESISSFVNHSKKRRCSTSSSVSANKQSVITTQTETHPNYKRIVFVEELNYPLQRMIPETLFEKYKFEQSTLLKLKDTVNLLRHQSTQYENVINFKPVEVNKMVLSAEYFFTELTLLIKCTTMELNLSNVIPYINKIILVTKKLLLSTLDYLKKVEDNITNEDIKAMNSLYLYRDDFKDKKDHCLFSQVPWNENELGIELRRCLSILAVIANYNLYLLQCLTGQCKLKLKDCNEYSNNFKELFNMETLGDQECDLLNIIYKTTQIIGRVRRTHQFPGFLSSVLYLLDTILYGEELSLDSYTLIHAIFKEIVFSRPDISAAKYISMVLLSMSNHKNLVPLLCNNSHIETFRRAQDCYMFTQDTCTFQIVAILLEKYKSIVNIASDIINFVFNALTNNSTWMNPQEQKCECLFKVYKTSIEILYDLMEDTLKKKIETEQLKLYNSIFLTGLIVISILTYKSPDLIIGCRRIYSQYFMWIRQIKEIKNDLNLETSQLIALENLLLSICNDSEEHENEKMINEDDKTNLINDIQLLNMMNL